jgi:hypothetical protein
VVSHIIANLCSTVRGIVLNTSFVFCISYMGKSESIENFSFLKNDMGSIEKKKERKK